MADKPLDTKVQTIVDRIMAAQKAAGVVPDWTPKEHAALLDLLVRDAYSIKPPQAIGKDSTKDQIKAHEEFAARTKDIRGRLADGRLMYCSNMKSHLIPKAEKAKAQAAEYE